MILFYFVIIVFQSVTLHTDVGDIKIEVFCEECPKTAEVNKYIMYFDTY